MDQSGFGIDLYLHRSPTYFPKSRCRTKNRFFAALVFVKSFANNFSRLTTKEIDNHFTIRDTWSFANVDFSIMQTKTISLLFEYFGGALEQLLFGILCCALHSGSHNHCRAARAGGDVVRRYVGIELGHGNLIQANG